jgi:hypothetical protein
VLFSVGGTHKGRLLGPRSCPPEGLPADRRPAPCAQHDSRNGCRWEGAAPPVVRKNSASITASAPRCPALSSAARRGGLRGAGATARSASE